MEQQRSLRAPSGRAVSLVSLVVLLCLSLGSLPIQAKGIDAPSVLAVTALAAVGVAIHLVANIERNWLRLDTVFILGFLVVNFQWPLMYAVSDLVPLYSFQSKTLEQSGNYSVAVAAISLISWMIGYSFKPIPSAGRKIELITGGRKLALTFLMFIVGFALTAGDAFFSRSIYTSVTEDIYLTVGGVGAYFFVIVEIVALLSMSYLMYRWFVLPAIGLKEAAWRSASMGVLSALLIVYCAIFLVGGERGQVVSILLGASVAFAARVRPVRLWEFLAVSAVGFLVFSAVGILRTGDNVSLFDFTSNFGYWEISTNLAQSIVTLTQSVSIVDERGTVFFGLLWISQILGLIPFAQGLFLSWTGLSIADISSAVLITNYTFGDNQTSGLGTSFVADVYLNFGIPGVLVFSMLYGAICARISLWMRGEHGFMRYFVAVAFGSFMIYIARSSLLFQLKPVLWGLAFAYLLVRVHRVVATRGGGRFDRP